MWYMNIYTIYYGFSYGNLFFSVSVPKLWTWLKLRIFWSWLGWDRNGCANGLEPPIRELNMKKTQWKIIRDQTWLVVWTPLKNMKVNWDDDIPNCFWENNPVMFQENHQPETVHHQNRATPPVSEMSPRLRTTWTRPPESLGHGRRVCASRGLCFGGTMQPWYLLTSR